VKLGVNVLSKADLVSLIGKYRSVRIFPDTSIDSLIASSILLKNLVEHNISAKISLDTKILVDEKDVPAILINLPPVNPSTQVSISFKQDYSVAGFVTSILDDLFTVEWWDKVLAIIAALYRGLYVLKEGRFKGLEDKLLRELVGTKKLEEVPTLPRIWGVKRVGLVKAMARTLIPFLPGITGSPEKVREIALQVFKKDPDQLRNIESASDKDDVNRVLEFFSIIAQLLKTNIVDLSNKIFGDFIIVSEPFDDSVVQLSEAMGSLALFSSLRRDSPLYVTSISLDMSILPEIISIYDSYIDEAASMLGVSIPSQLSKKNGVEAIDVEDFLERPGLIIDILGSLNALPQKKPVSILYGGEKITELRELLRSGVKPEEAYTTCDEVQLCRVK